MLIFLMWHKGSEAGKAIDARQVESRLQSLYAPLFAERPASRIIENETMGLVALEKPVNGWIPLHYEENEHSWALAAKYPVTAKMALQRNGCPAPDGQVLLKLGERLEQDSESLLRDLAPMFAVIWGNKGTGDTYVQNDGLGHAQIFEHNDGRLWAVSNKLTAFQPLGISLQPEPNEWAVRMTLDWFPLQMTGFRNISFLAPGTRLCLISHEVSRKRFDVLGYWLQRENLKPEECLELAYDGFHRHICAVAPLGTTGVCGLTGGRDSRAVASALLKEKITTVRFSVRGHGRNKIDAEIASELAQKAGVRLRIMKTAGAAPNSPEALQRCTELALLWQSGYIDIGQHDGFMNGSEELGGGDVNFMGQHGEIGRGYFAERIDAVRHRPSQFEERLLRFALRENTNGHLFISPTKMEFIRETVRAAYRQASGYQLQGLDQLDFFYLYERTRRWASAGNHIQPGILITPFLIPEYIHAVFNYPAHLRNESCPFHSYIVERNMPEWADVVYEKELKILRQKKRAKKERRQSPVNYYRKLAQKKLRSWIPALAHSRLDGPYANEGRTLIEKTLLDQGFWTEVFDPDRVCRHWSRAPHQLLVTAMLMKSLKR